MNGPKGNNLAEAGLEEGEAMPSAGTPQLEGSQGLSCALLGAKASLCGRKDDLSYPPCAFILTVSHDGGPEAHLSPCGSIRVVKGQSYDNPSLLKLSVGSPMFSENIIQASIL